MDTPDLKWPPQNGLWNLAKGPTILAQSDQWDLLAYGEIRTAREREMPYFHVFPCYYLLFHVICTFVGYFLYSDLRSKCWRLKLLHWESQSSKICMTCEVYFLKINLPAVSPDTCPFLIERDLQT